MGSDDTVSWLLIRHIVLVVAWFSLIMAAAVVFSCLRENASRPWMLRQLRKLWHLTGGRPMMPVKFSHVSRLRGKHPRKVWYYRDRLGRTWLATSPWSRFRIRPIEKESPRG